MTSSSIAAQLAALPADVTETLKRYQFDPERFQKLASTVRGGSAEDNVVRGRIAPPTPEDVPSLPERGTPERARLEAIGKQALSEGKVALVLLAGGMATRMGGVVKSLVDALPGKTFLDLRLAEIAALTREYGKAPPLWLMTSHTTDGPIRDTLGDRLAGDALATFPQFLSLRLTPEGDVFLDASGRPSEHAPGHGDLPEALQRSGLVKRFVERGGQVVMMSNIDNLGGTIDPALTGFHIDKGRAVTCEVVDKVEGDKGGIPVRVDGKPCVLEEFRIPSSFDPATVRVFSTNVFHFDARALSTLDIPWSYFRVTKKVDGKPVIQFERLVNEVTSYVPSAYVRVPRTGADARFLPVKDTAELEARRGEIEAVARPRGWLG